MFLQALNRKVVALQALDSMLLAEQIGLEQGGARPKLAAGEVARLAGISAASVSRLRTALGAVRT
jgi:hypothetical protein